MEMTLPTTASAFPGYDILSYNYHVAAAAAAGVTQPQFNVSNHYNHSSFGTNKSDSRTSNGRESRGTRERKDSYSKDKDQKSTYGSQIDHDKPPFSRVFVVCSKSHTSDDLKTVFEEFGKVEDVWVVKDKHTKENRGVAYVKFSKMSEACLAVESLDGRKLTEEEDEPSSKPLKVIIAQPKSSKSTEDFNDESALTRLFVVIPKGVDEKEMRKAFEGYGDIDYVQIVKDRHTGEKKGFGYVKYNRAYDAAMAIENCDRSYRAVMAEPKSSKAKREFGNDSGLSFPPSIGRLGSGLELAMSLQNNNRPVVPEIQNIPPVFNIGVSESNRSNSLGNRLQVHVSTLISQEQLARLFDLIPGMELCDLKKNYSTGESKGIAVLVYNSVGSAIYAKEKLNGFEYPPGCKLIVRYAPDEDEEIVIPSRSSSVDPSQMICSVQLPSPKPLSNSESCAERLFIVCHPTPPPDNALKDVFSRFGDLIDVYMLRNKNFGYAKYSKIESAEKAMQVLHGAEILGKRLKVLQAEPPKSSEGSRKRPRT